MLVLFLTTVFAFSSAQVIDLNDSILESLDKGPWLINFYAPWCGYCRRLEPTYEKVGQYFASIASPVKIARLDATTHLKAGRYFQVDGFPTIKFVNKDQSFTYTGDRSLHSMVSFVLRANGPAVKTLANTSTFEGNASLIKPDPFFVLIDRRDSLLKASYEKLADQYRLLMWFFSVPSPSAVPTKYAHLLRQAEQVHRGVIVFKDADGVVFPGLPNVFVSQSDIATQLEHRLRDWLLRERYPVYMEVRVADLWEIGSTEMALQQTRSEEDKTGPDDNSPTEADQTQFPYRLVALFLLNSPAMNDGTSARFKEFGRSLAQRRVPELDKRFQFAWTDQQLDVLSNLAMVSLVAPSLIVVDPITRLIYLNPNQTTVNGLYSLESEVVLSFLLAVTDGRVPGYGGNTIPIRLRRMGYNFVVGLKDFVRTSPIIALLIFGIPTMFLGCVGYLCCCMDEQYDEMDVIRPPGSLSTDSAQWSSDAAISATTAGEAGDGDSDVVRQRRVPYSPKRHAVREVKELGPVVSKEEIDARRAAYQEWKKSM